jgi:hypothetical protein
VLVPAFDISTLTHAVELDPRTAGRVDFNVQSQIAKTVFARADLEPDGANTVAIGSWLSVEGGKHERRFEATAAEKYTVLVSPPADAVPGTYLFRLRMVTTSESASEFQALSEPVEVTVKPLVPVFAISTPTPAMELDPGGTGRVEFAVQNQINEAISARAELEPDAANPAAIAPWLAVEGEPERRFEAAAAETYMVLISAPADAVAGAYAFRLRMVTTSETVSTFEYLSEPVAVALKAPARNWWRIVAIALAVVNVALLLAAGGLMLPAGRGPTVDCSPSRTANGVPVGGPTPYKVGERKEVCVRHLGIGFPVEAEGVLRVRYGDGRELRIPIEALLLTGSTTAGCTFTEFPLPTQIGVASGRTIELDPGDVDLGGSTTCEASWKATIPKHSGELYVGFLGTELDAPPPD